MNKLVIPTILSFTVLIAGIFAFMPIEKASTVHDQIIAALGGPIATLSLQKTLDGEGAGAGTDVTWTITAVTDVVVHQIYVDNTPTNCTITGPHDDHGTPNDNRVDCEESDYRRLGVNIAGSVFKGAEFPDKKAKNDHIAVRGFLPNNMSDTPLKAAETIELTFDTENTTNDVILKITVSVTGVAELT